MASKMIIELQINDSGAAKTDTSMPRVFGIQHGIFLANGPWWPSTVSVKTASEELKQVYKQAAANNSVTIIMPHDSYSSVEETFLRKAYQNKKRVKEAYLYYNPEFDSSSSYGGNMILSNFKVTQNRRTLATLSWSIMPNLVEIFTFEADQISIPA